MMWKGFLENQRVNEQSVGMSALVEVQCLRLSPEFQVTQGIACSPEQLPPSHTCWEIFGIGHKYFYHEQLFYLYTMYLNSY